MNDSNGLNHTVYVLPVPDTEEEHTVSVDVLPKGVFIAAFIDNEPQGYIGLTVVDLWNLAQRDSGKGEMGDD